MGAEQGGAPLVPGLRQAWSLGESLREPPFSEALDAFTPPRKATPFIFSVAQNVNVRRKLHAEPRWIFFWRQNMADFAIACLITRISASPFH